MKIQIEDEDEAPECPTCCGTGEGPASDTTCSTCGGKGELRKKNKYHNEEPPDIDEWEWTEEDQAKVDNQCK